MKGKTAPRGKAGKRAAAGAPREPGEMPLVRGLLDRAFREGANYSLYLLASHLGVESRDIRGGPGALEEKAARLGDRIRLALSPEE